MIGCLAAVPLLDRARHVGFRHRAPDGDAAPSARWNCSRAAVMLRQIRLLARGRGAGDAAHRPGCRPSLARTSAACAGNRKSFPRCGWTRGGHRPASRKSRLPSCRACRYRRRNLTRAAKSGDASLILPWCTSIRRAGSVPGQIGAARRRLTIQFALPQTAPPDSADRPAAERRQLGGKAGIIKSFQ